MSTGPRLRPSVLAAREKLAEGRSKLRAQHDRGSPGIQVCTRLTEATNEALKDPAVQASLVGALVRTGSADDFAAILRDDLARVARQIEETKFKAE